MALLEIPPKEDSCSRIKSRYSLLDAIAYSPVSVLEFLALIISDDFGLQQIPFSVISVVSAAFGYDLENAIVLVIYSLGIVFLIAIVPEKLLVLSFKVDYCLAIQTKAKSDACPVRYATRKTPCGHSACLFHRYSRLWRTETCLSDSSSRRMSWFHITPLSQFPHHDVFVILVYKNFEAQRFI